MVKVHIELSGGLELLFGNQKEHDVDVPVCEGQEALTAGQVVVWARDNMLRERPELFVKGNSVRPGILVLINDCDWELSGGIDSPIAEGDQVVFISTLHGG
ncbi:Ubiquitin-related modifier 1 [Tetrabaena socialis]|uniref:Ubiquitin-related modifier 1 homolog n=1 Tax=Tetrabaena socialis TaxID=47790 RepID=A0A2J8AIX3_9CHLO|nr:Ubiquitin-related modifier 1 [Tetrabaena socialis]|eukprot:PNH12463.1 Ubiquitin-related modifier 1 [Tetrabaena socialis]